MLTLIKMKWILMLFLLLYTAGSYLHCAVLYGDVLAQKYTIVLDFKDTPVEAILESRLPIITRYSTGRSR